MTTWILSRHKEPDEAYPTEAEADAARKAHGPGDAVVWALGDDDTDAPQTARNGPRSDEQPDSDPLGVAITARRRKWGRR